MDSQDPEFIKYFGEPGNSALTDLMCTYLVRLLELDNIDVVKKYWPKEHSQGSTPKDIFWRSVNRGLITDELKDFFSIVKRPSRGNLKNLSKVCSKGNMSAETALNYVLDLVLDDIKEKKPIWNTEIPKYKETARIVRQSTKKCLLEYIKVVEVMEPICWIE